MWRRKEGDSLSSEVKCFRQVSFLFIQATAEKTLPFEAKLLCVILVIRSRLLVLQL